MLSWALTFFVVAIIAAVLGFTSIAGAAAGIAKILFFIFLVLTLAALVGGALRGRPPVCGVGRAKRNGAERPRFLVGAAAQRHANSNAWLTATRTVSGTKGLVTRNVGSGRSPVSRRSG